MIKGKILGKRNIKDFFGQREGKKGDGEELCSRTGQRG
jgi:hypothetical protein